MGFVALPAVQTFGCGFPWLVETFKVEDVGIPVQCSADTFLPEGIGVIRSCNSGALVLVIVVVAATWELMSTEVIESLAALLLLTVGWPASLTVPKLNGVS